MAAGHRTTKGTRTPGSLQVHLPSRPWSLMNTVSVVWEAPAASNESSKSPTLRSSHSVLQAESGFEHLLHPLAGRAAPSDGSRAGPPSLTGHRRSIERHLQRRPRMRRVRQRQADVRKKSARGAHGVLNELAGTLDDPLSVVRVGSIFRKVARVESLHGCEPSVVHCVLNLRVLARVPVPLTSHVACMRLVAPGKPVQVVLPEHPGSKTSIPQPRRNGRHPALERGNALVHVDELGLGVLVASSIARDHHPSEQSRARRGTKRTAAHVEAVASLGVGVRRFELRGRTAASRLATRRLPPPPIDPVTASANPQYRHEAAAHAGR
eukprot:scaffold86218_cov66-Phaeocystis_antarctica.AAC.5